VNESLADIAVEVSACRRCPLGSQRTHAVPGEGPADARVLLIGEGPGFHEDQQGRPFVGASGQLLEDLLASIGLSRRQVFIANVIKCRPPGNRDPEPAELTACREFLDRQIAALQPAVIVTLGRFSMERYFPGQAITRIHGRAKRLGDAFFLPLFHPAAALRNPAWRQELTQDFRKIPELLAQLAAEKNPSPAAGAAPGDPDDGGEGYTQLSLFS
jgi:DNA polymerase